MKPQWPFKPCIGELMTPKIIFPRKEWPGPTKDWSFKYLFLHNLNSCLREQSYYSSNLINLHSWFGKELYSPRYLKKTWRSSQTPRSFSSCSIASGLEHSTSTQTAQGSGIVGRTSQNYRKLGDHHVQFYCNERKKCRTKPSLENWKKEKKEWVLPTQPQGNEHQLANLQPEQGGEIILKNLCAQSV